MNRISKVLVGAAIGLMVGSSTVWAGTAPGAGTIVYSPDVQQAVPTLSGWTLIVLALLFGVIAYRVMREKHGRTLASLTAAGILAAGASTGVKMIDEAHAAVMAIPLDIAVGSQATIQEGESAYQNTTNVPQRIRSILYNTGCEASPTPPSGSPVCAVNLLIQPSDMCWLNTVCASST